MRSLYDKHEIRWKSTREFDGNTQKKHISKEIKLNEVELNNW